MVKASIMSCILHVVVLLIVISQTTPKPPKISNIGENIEVRIVSEDKGTLTNPLKGNSIEDRKKIESTTNTAVEKPIDKMVEELEKKTIVEKPTERKKTNTEKIEKPAETKKKKVEAVVKEQFELKEENVTNEIKEIKPQEIVEDKVERTSNNESVIKGSETTEINNAENNVSSEEQVRGSEKGAVGEDLVKLSDGTYIAKHQGIKGLSFGFISNPEPDYPSLARKLGFKDEMIVKVIMEFDSSGKLDDMRFVGEKDSFGFRNEVEKTVKQWRLTPIKYNDINVKMRFYKSFKFERLN